MVPAVESATPDPGGTFPPVDAEAVERARLRRNRSGKISAALRGERMESSLRLVFRAAFQDNVQSRRFRCPDTKMCPPIAN